MEDQFFSIYFQILTYSLTGKLCKKSGNFFPFINFDISVNIIKNLEIFIISDSYYAFY